MPMSIIALRPSAPSSTLNSVNTTACSALYNTSERSHSQLEAPMEASKRRSLVAMASAMAQASTVNAPM